MKFRVVFMLMFIQPIVGFSQISGVKTIGVDFPTIAAAVTALNTQGVSNQGVFINVPAGYTETVPFGGIQLGSNVLNPTVVWPNPGYNKGIRFQKIGTGPNPVLMAFTGSSSTSSDGIFKFLGVDNVKIDGIDLVENPANSGNALMEWGYAFVNLNPTGNIDGCRRDTIKNCKITLNRLNPNGSYGIFSKFITANNASTRLTATAQAHFHFEFRIFSNFISNVTSGIYIDNIPGPGSAPVTSGSYSGFHHIGDDGTNRIENFGGVPGLPAYGIWEESNGGSHISNNKIDNINGGGVTHGNSEIIGIKCISDAYFFTVERNNIRLTTSGNNQIIAGIYSQGGLHAQQDTIEFIDGINAGPHYGIYSRSSGILLSGIFARFYNNVFKASSTGQSSSDYFFTYHTGPQVPGTLDFSDNKFHDINLNTSGISSCMFNASTVGFFNAFSNSIRNFKNAGPSGNFFGIYCGASLSTRRVWVNVFDSILFTHPAFTSSLYGVLSKESCADLIFLDNDFSKFYTTGAGPIHGIVDSAIATTKEIKRNSVSQFYTSAGGSGGASMTGMSVAGTSNSLQMFDNRVSKLKSTGNNPALVSHIKGYILSGGTVNDFYRNMLSDLSTNSTTGSVIGLQINGGTENNIYNNFLGGFTAPFSNMAGDVIRGVDFQNSNPNSLTRFYYNTVNINASSSGANFAATGVYHTASTNATTANLSMRNNIIYNNSNAKGTGIVTAFRRSNGSSGMLANYNTNSNNNLFYAGNPGPSQLIYYDGTSSAQTLTAYQNGVFPGGTIAPRDNVSVTEPNVPFLNTSSLAADYLHLSPTIPTLAEGGAAPVTGTFSVLTDFDNQTRHASTPDIGADEFNGVKGVPCTAYPVINPVNSVIGCHGSAVAAVVFAGNMSGTVYTWTNSNPSIGLSAGGTGNLPAFNAVNTGTNPITANITVVPSVSIGAATCTGVPLIFSITVHPQPTVTLTATPSNQYTNGQPITLTAAASPAGGVYAWYKNGTLIPGLTSSVLGGLSLNDLGSYHVSYTLNGCTSVSSPVDITGTGPGIVLFNPNPNNGQFQIRFNNAPNEAVKLVAVNMLGQIVYEGRFISGPTPYSQLNIDLGFKATGIYIIKLFNAAGTRIFAKPILVHYK